MKIGVMTFHWATNYGAVLQSYALVKCLKEMGYEAEDINYLPRETMLKLRFFDLYLRRFANIKRSSIFKKFRKNVLTVSKKTYGSNRTLHGITNEYDAIITGSDQIWNKSFLMTAEKKPTPSYFLDFVPENVLRISYAASFGSNELSEEVKKYGLPELRKFHAVSVRENNAVGLLGAEGIPAKAVCDPTLLLEPASYAEIIKPLDENDRVELFNFMLRTGRDSTDKTNQYMVDSLFAGKKSLGEAIIPVEDWLWKLKNSDFVVTDSFHCVVFSIIFHKPFLAINDKNCAMNARIRTLTERLGLAHRVLEEYDTEKIRKIVADQEFDWKSVDEKRRAWADESKEFLIQSLKR